jgi:RNA polymerase II subunit A small phosphatase-like protein
MADIYRRKLLVLDLDETLVFASETELDRSPDLSVAGYHVYKRPYLDTFLAFAFDNFRVGVWTSSGRLYAEPLVAQLMAGRHVEFVWSSIRCSIARDWDTGGHTTQKRLAKLKKLGFKLSEMIGVDDTPSKYVKNYGNLVQVGEWTGTPEDDELIYLIQYLGMLRDVPNVRSVEKRNWRSGLTSE